MRQIKFRAWCERHKKLEIYSLGDLICGAATSGANEGGIFKNWSEFTGLLDKNGKEIYEGDIIHWLAMKSDKHDKVVKFEKRAQYLGWNIASGSRYIIVGNVHENPELLKP